MPEQQPSGALAPRHRKLGRSGLAARYYAEQLVMLPDLWPGCTAWQQACLRAQELIPHPPAVEACRAAYSPEMQHGWAAMLQSSCCEGWSCLTLQ